MTRRIVVTGSASGIGRATADLLRERGDDVIGVDLRDADVAADLSTPEGRAAAAAAVAERCPEGIDAIVACAGLSGVTPLLVQVNYFGVTELLTALRPLLAKSAEPRAVVIGSISGTMPHDAELVDACLAGDEQLAVKLAQAAVDRGEPRKLYPSSKAALARWIRRTAIAPGWADAGIPLNAVAPGNVLTPMMQPILDDPEMKKVMDQAVPMPLNGYAKPEVLARALTWLVSPENSHITGQTIYVDGGAEVTTRGDGRW
ncbi:SDR family oxidoreductase [Rhodococcus sp. NPDC058514]|uniref:SDR family oxidoreductase n=1 Tax=unclassified Rhodococcus (in: high G+C Gram-positive bacteria) TaxID=192944 RepID=UPI003660CC63